jgi:hypothetical protein
VTIIYFSRFDPEIAVAVLQESPVAARPAFEIENEIAASYTPARA